MLASMCGGTKDWACEVCMGGAAGGGIAMGDERANDCDDGYGLCDCCGMGAASDVNLICGGAENIGVAFD